MKKNTKLLIGTAIGVAVLAAALTVVLMLPSRDTDIKVEDNNAILLYDKTALTPEDITVRNEGGEYQLLCYEVVQPVSKEEESSEDSSIPVLNASELEEDSKDATEEHILLYTMQEYPTETLSRTMTDNLAEECRYMAASKLIDKSGIRYGEYGLDQPRAEAKIVFSDNSSVRLQFGKEAPDNMGVYLRYNEDPNVYLVPSNLVEMFFVEKLQMFEKKLTAGLGDNLVQEVTVSGTGYPQELQITKNDTNAISGTYVMKQPYRASITDSQVQNLANGFYSFSAAEVAAVGVKESDLSKYGLDQPYQKLSMKLDNDKVSTIIAGQKDQDGKIYLTTPKNTIVYRMNAEDIPWYGVEKSYFLTSGILEANENAIDTMTVRQNGKEDVYRFEREYKVSDNYMDNVISNVYLGKEKLNIQYVLYYIADLSGIRRQDKAPGSLDGSKEIFSVKYTYIKDSPLTDTLTLYETSDKKIIAVLNGNIEGFINAGYARELMQQTEALRQNEFVYEMEQPEQSSSAS